MKSLPIQADLSLMQPLARKQPLQEKPTTLAYALGSLESKISWKNRVNSEQADGRNLLIVNAMHLSSMKTLEEPILKD